MTWFGRPGPLCHPAFSPPGQNLRTSSEVAPVVTMSAGMSTYCTDVGGRKSRPLLGLPSIRHDDRGAP